MARSVRQALIVARDRAVVARDRVRAVRTLRQSIASLSAPPPAAFASFGRDAWIVPPARVENADCIRVGAGVIILEHSCLTVARDIRLPQPVLEFGDGTRINRFVNVVCLGSVTFGKDVLVGDRVYVSDVDYPWGRAGSSWEELAQPRPVVIGDGVFLGSGVIVKPGVTIGEHSYVSAASIVADDVAPRTLVAGAPARAVRRLMLDHEA